MTSTSERLILVTGATGQQGGAVVDALLEAGGWRVRALTRDPESDKAKALATRSVEVVRGDFDAVATVDAAMTGVHGVFSVQVVMGPDSATVEKRQGFGVVDAAKRAGVSYLVYSSAAGVDRDAGTATQSAKVDVAQYVHSSGIPYTIIRPVSFMENFRRARERIEGGTFAQALGPDTHQDYVAIGDIGRVAAAAFARPDDFQGQTVDLAGDRFTQLEAAEIFSRVLGRTVEYTQTPRDRIPPFMLNLMEWLEANDGYGVDAPDTIRARWGVPLLTLEEWVRKEGWSAA